MYENYYPLAADAKARNEAGGYACGQALRRMVAFEKPRERRIRRQREQFLICTKQDAVLKFHDPDKGINVAVGPVAVHSCSMELLKGATALRKKYNLCGHTHLLETRAQALMAKQFFPSQSAVKHLRESGFPDLPGTSCAHTVPYG